MRTRKTQEPFPNDLETVRQRRHNLFVEALADHKAIHDHFDPAVFVFIEVDFLAQIVDRFVDAHPAVALGADVVEQVGVIFAIDLEHRCANLDFRAAGQGQKVFHHLMRRPDADFLPCDGAARLSNTCEQHSQIVIEVRHRPHRRAGILHHGLLFYGDDRGQAVHEVDVGLLQLGDESPGESRKRFHEPPLTFGVYGVERQGGLPGTAHSGDNDQLVARDFEVDIPQVVLAGALDFNRRSHR